MVKALKNAPLTFRAMALIVCPIFLTAIAVYYFYIRSALPTLQGTQYVSGLINDVSISRDEHGVVFIDASTDKDVYFAMGYVHAQDRLWQLELQRRLSQGRMAEVFGESSVNGDVWMRTLGIYESAQGSKKHLSGAALESLEAYRRGINAWATAGNQLPIEFEIHGITFEKWKIEDSLAWQKVFSLNLSGNYKYELLKHIGKQYLSTDAFDLLFEPKVNGYRRTDIARGLSLKSATHLLDLQNHFEQDLKVGGNYVGSNAFAISGKYTESGFPILANDPHLAIQMPSLWYAVSQKGEKLRTQGFNLVGLPVVIFGRNEHIAWGGTNMMADVQDLVIEAPDAENPERYWYKQAWKNFETRVERVDVKAQFPSFLRPRNKPIDFMVRNSDNGPIISDVTQGLDQAVALKWVTLNQRDKSYESFYLANYASNLEEFRASFVDYVAPALNLLYADKENNIALLGVGKIPLRKEGNGTLPRVASDGEYWDGYIPFDEMPFVLNPESGLIVNANNANVGSDYPHFISTEFAPAYRANRISELLAAKKGNNEKIGVQDTFNTMADVKDTSVRDLLSLLVTVSPKKERQQMALEYLKTWDLIASEESIAPSIYYRWIWHVKERLFSQSYVSVWNHKVHSNYMKNIDTMLSEKRLSESLRSNQRWCQRNQEMQFKSCQEFLLFSLDEALEELTKLRGKNMENWQWGKLQTKTYAHTPFSQLASLKSIFERKHPAAGAPNTVNVSSGFFDESRGYISNFGAGFRQTMDLSDRNNHFLMNSTGQSGQFASEHYDDMVEPFKNVQMHKINSEGKPLASLLLKPLQVHYRQ